MARILERTRLRVPCLKLAGLTLDLFEVGDSPGIVDIIVGILLLLCDCSFNPLVSFVRVFKGLGADTPRHRLASGGPIYSAAE